MIAIQLISLIAALAVVFVAYAIYAYSGTMIDERRTLRRRLNTASQIDPVVATDAPADIPNDQSLSGIAIVITLLQRFSVSEWLNTMILQSGMKIQLATVLYIQAGLALSTIFCVRFMSGAPWGAAVLSGVVFGLFMPLVMVHRQRKKRFIMFATRFPAAISMLQSSLHAGHSLNYALEIATEELPDPVASEFRRVLEEMRLGLSAREALTNLYRRIPIEELRFFMIAVVLTREVGGNLSEVLGTLGTTLRERMKLRQQCRALSAQGRAAALMLFILPPGVALLANMVSPGFIEPLYATPAGRLCTLTALLFEVAGVIMSRKIVNPKEFAFK
jgi:tight adherence protein B